jgi:7-cyano-7-deazaguanine synthase
MAHTSENRAVALVSGGLDSVVSLAEAVLKLDVRLVLFCNYGQRALEAERGAVLGVVNYYGLPLREVDLTWIADLSPEGMRRAGTAGPDGDELDTLADVWIPNRNGIFLNVAAAFAEHYGCGLVITGFNREEAAEFPDNSKEFVEVSNRCFEFSTRAGVRVQSYTLDLTKRQIIRKAM